MKKLLLLVSIAAVLSGCASGVKLDDVQVDDRSGGAAGQLGGVNGGHVPVFSDNRAAILPGILVKPLLAVQPGRHFHRTPLGRRNLYFLRLMIVFSCF